MIPSQGEKTFTPKAKRIKIICAKTRLLNRAASHSSDITIDKQWENLFSISNENQTWFQTSFHEAQGGYITG